MLVMDVLHCLTENVDDEKEDLHWEEPFGMEPANSAVNRGAESTETMARKAKRRRKKSKPWTHNKTQGRLERLRMKKRKRQKVLELLLDSNCKQEENGKSVNKCCRAKEIPMIRRYGNFLCGVCLKPFSKLYKLTCHSYTHTGDWPYICAICEKHFVRSSLLKKHMFCHDNKELFICARCKKQFTSWVQFERHMFRQSRQKGDYKCTICKKRFTRPENLKNHMQYHENKESFACPICLKQLSNPKSLRRHVELHVSGPAKESDHNSGKQFHDVQDARDHMPIHASSDETKSVEHGITCTQLAEEQSTVDYDTKPEFTCMECANAFPTLDNLEDHMYQHSTTRPHKCTQCEEQFSLPASLSIHMMKHTECSNSSAHVPECRNVKSYVCGECGKTLASAWGYKRHLFLHTGERPYKCYVCGDRFALVGHLKTHISACHSNSEGFPYKCTECQKVLSHPASLLNHMRYHKKKTSLVCPICSKQLSTSWGLKEHIRRIHIVDSKNENQTNPRSYTCGQCGKTLTSRRCYLSHMFLHTDKCPHTCTVCDKIFILATDLRRHMNVHRSDREVFPCSECGKQLFSRRSLERHITMHAGTHACAVCDKTFADTTHLRKHMDVHRSDRAIFPCSECGTRLFSQCALEQHITMHAVTQKHCGTGISRTYPRSYTCAKCGKTLRSQYSYSNHMSLHAGERPHACTVCDKTFTFAAGLRRHMDVHCSDRELFPCSECGKGLISQRALERHMTIHTGTQKHCCTVCDRRSVL